MQKSTQTGRCKTYCLLLSASDSVFAITDILKAYKFLITQNCEMLLLLQQIQHCVKTAKIKTTLVFAVYGGNLL